jgi:hypothetical protein
MGASGRVTFREFRAVLKARLGAAGRSDRVLAVWRRLGAGAGGSAAGSVANVAAWQARVAAAEARAQLAEERERTHQDRWATEVRAVRDELAAAQVAGRMSYRIYDQHREALQEVQRLRQELAELKEGAGRS